MTDGAYGDNPFNDPDVQQNVNMTDNVYDNNSNPFEDNQTTENTGYGGPPAPPTNVYEDVVTDTAINVGKSTAQQVGNDIQNDYNETAKNNENQHVAPPTPNWCEKCMYWFPLQWFNFFGGFITALFAVLDIVISSNDTSFIGYIIYFYLVFFGFIIMFVEAPSFKLTRSTQISLYFWFRFLSRLWGRGWFYLFVALLCMGELNSKDDPNASAFAGFFLILMTIVSWIVSRAAAKKYQRFYVFIAAGTEGEERDKKFEEKFKSLDMDQDGFLVSADIVKLAEQAGRDLANSERHCIQTFLDESCNGKVSLQDFQKQFSTYNMKQRFL